MMDYMKIELETVINFLKKNDLDWNGEIISGTHLNKSILASSEDFNGKDLKVCLNNATLFLNVSPTKFLIKSLTNHMDGNLVVLQNYSDKWQQYLVETCLDRELLNKLLEECELEIIKVDEELFKEIQRLSLQMDHARVKRNEKVAKIKNIKKIATANINGR